VTDFTEIDQRARDAAERLRASVDDAIPSLEHAIRRSSQKRARGMTVMAAVLICAVVGVGAVGVSMMRTGTERPEAGVKPLQGAWALPRATDAVSTEPRPSATSGSSKPTRTQRPAARVVKGPWTAVVRGHRLILRDPATNTAIVQRIESPEPGRFSVVEASSGGTASFGCTNVGDYGFERTDSGALRVYEVADSCEPRVEILIAGVWTGLGGPTSTDGLPTDEPTPSDSVSQEPAPTVSFPEPGTPSPEDPTPSEQPNAAT
jgi:hypothetical protein